MSEGYYLTPLARSKMLTKFLEKSPDELLCEEQHEVYKAEIARNREHINQSNIQHENRLREIRINYEHKLQTAKQSFEDEIKSLQDRLWNLRHSFDQEKQAQLSRSHRFAISKLEYSEKIEKLVAQKQRLTRELMIIEQNDNQAHKIKVSNLKTQYDNQSNEFRIEKRRCEELIAEEGSRLRQKLDEKQKKIEILLERKQLLNNNLNELQAQNTSKMQKIEKSLKSSQRKAETHEEQMNKVLEKQKTFKLESLEEEIQEKEFQISKSKEKNEKLLDQLLRLEKILYGKSPLTNI
jgi:chromosome segregation ATPase